MMKKTLLTTAILLALAACQPPEADKPSAPADNAAPSFASGAAVSGSQNADGTVVVTVSDTACEPMQITLAVKPHLPSKITAVAHWNGKF